MEKAETWQPELPFVEREPLTASCWEKALSERLGRKVQVTYNRARTMPVQVQWRGGLRTCAQVRLHEIFRSAPDEVVEAMASWIRVGKRARRRCDVLDVWLARKLAQLPPRRPRRAMLRTVGDNHDLGDLVEGLYREEFARDFSEQRPRPQITWGRRSRSRNRHSIQLGSFDSESRVVRVHPVLDRKDVPSWYVRVILFHELLHATLTSEKRDGGRCLHHDPEFRRRERAYGDHPRAVAWEKKNLGRLIRLARKKPGDCGLRPVAGEDASRRRAARSRSG